MQMFKRVLLSSLFAILLCLNIPGHAFAVPVAITNLSGLASTTTRGSIVLTWTAPSDGGSPAAGYDLRVATSAFTDTDWDALWVNPVLGEPVPSTPGTTQTMTVSSLVGGVTYYFRMKSSDASQAMSAISDNPIAWACAPISSGKLYDLSVGTGVTRWAYESTAADITTPVAGTQFITEQYTGIAYDDAVHGVSSGTASQIIAQRFLFKVSQSTPTITKLSVSWRGWNEAELGTGAVPSLYIWDYNSGTPGWDLITSGSGSLSDQTLSGEYTTNINYYISNSSCNLKLTCPDPGTTSKRSRIHSNYVSLSVTYSVVADTIAPAAITNLAGAMGALDKQVTLSWTAPGDNGSSGNNAPTAAYEVRYATFGVTSDTNTWWNNGYGALSTYAQNWPVQYQSETENKTLTMLASGTTYWFAVQTIDASGNPSGISGLNGMGPVKAISKYPPGQVTGLAAVTGSQVQLSWTAPGDHGYEGNVTGGMWRIDYSSVTTTPGPDASYTLEISSSFTQGATTYGCMITGLHPRTTYYFQILARDGYGNWGTVWSSSASAVAGVFGCLEVDLTGVYDCALSWGDYDNDGELDIALAGSSISRVYRNDAGSFANATGTDITGVRYCSLSWGDYDNDGDPDLALAGYTGSLYLSRVYRNDAGSFANVTGASITGVQYGSLSWGDYDNDGDLDLALSGWDGISSYLSSVYRNDTGSFINATGASFTGVSGCLSWGDYDNDGDLDLALAGFNGLRYSRVYRNDAGSFVNATGASISGVSGGGSLNWGDYDNDGDLDLALSGYTGSLYISRVYRNDAGSFINATDTSIYGVNQCSLAFGDYDNDGDLDLALAGWDGNSSYLSRVYRNDAGSFNNAPPTSITGVRYCSLSWGDYDNDGDLDLALSGQTASSENISRIYKSFEADYGNANKDSRAPSAPGTGFDASYTYLSKTLSLRWGKGTDNGAGATPADGLYYEIRMATETLSDGLLKWVVSPSTGLGVGSASSQNIGTYPHGYCVASSTQAGAFIKSTNTLEGNTYYWQVRTIDAGLRKSEWSTAQLFYIPPQEFIAPAGISNLTALIGGTNTAILQWTAPGDDGASGNLGTNSMFRIRYSSVAIITAADFDSPPATLAAQTIDISTTATAQSMQSRTIPGLTEKRYWFAVKAMDESENWSVWNSSGDVSTVNTLAWCVFDATPPGQITGLTAVQGAQVQLTWTAPGDDEYTGNVTGGKWRIDYSSSTTTPGPDNSYSLEISSSFTQGTTTYGCAIPGLQPRATYYFQMIARDGAGNWGTVWSSSSSAVAGTFADLGTEVTGVSYSSLSWGDYDSDGDLDLALAGTYNGSNSVSRVYRNDAGSFINATGISIAGVWICSLSWGDYDNDGDLDLAVVGSNSGNQSRVYRNDEGSFVNATGSSITGVSGSLGWGDYDNDGDLDLALAGDSDSTISRVYRNDAGSFVNATDASITGVNGCSLSWGDYDNDGDLDLALAGYGSLGNTSRVYRNDACNFVNATGTSITAINNCSLSWGDYDNDGDLDLALAGNAGDTISRVYRNEAGSFVNATGASITGINACSLSWGDYDNDGDLDLALAGEDSGTPAYISRVYRNDDGSFVNATGTDIAGVYNCSLSWGDYDNDGDLDLALSGETASSVKISRIYQSYEADYGNANLGSRAPSAPGTGFDASYTYSSKTLSLRWGKGADNGAGATPTDGLYYEIRMATETIVDSLQKWVVSPSTGLGVGSASSQNIGTYPHGYCVASSTQAGAFIKSTNTLEGNTYYWQVRTIDAGLRKSAWSSAQLLYIPPQEFIAPAGISNLTALNGGANTAILQWTSPGDNGASGNLIAGSKYRIKYSSVAIITAADFDSPPAVLAAQTIDISTTATTQSMQSRTITGLTERNYWFAVKAMDECENWSVWNSSEDVSTVNTQAWFVFDTTPPGQITGLTAVTGAQVQLTWTAPGDDGYTGDVAGGVWRIDYSSTTTTPGPDASYSIEISSSFTQGADIYGQMITGLHPRTTYYFQIIARDGAGNWSSVWSSSLSAITGSFANICAGITGVTYSSLSWGDYDNDGDLDLAIGGTYDGGTNKITRVYRNDAGNFTNATGTSIPGVINGSLSWGDYDNDGDLDLALAGSRGSYISRVYRNDAGAFVNATGTSITGVHYCSLSWGDYDNDGDLDLSISGTYDAAINGIARVYRNDTGSFINATGTSITGVWYSSLSWGDYDNDGDLDLSICGSYDGGTNGIARVYRNDTGSFINATGTSITGVWYSSLSWGDYDNDGDLDLALSGAYEIGALITRVYRNDAGSFVNATGTSITGVKYSSLSWGDYDNDGDIDLALAGSDGSWYSRVYRNDAGSFTNSTGTSITGVDWSSLSWGDYDNDGDLDLALSGGAGGSTYIAHIYKSYEADYGNANIDGRAPSVPGTGFSASYTYSSKTLSLQWNKASDNGTGATPTDGLYYEIRMATETISDGLAKWFVSPSTGLGVGSASSQNIGTYPHGYCVASSTQAGAFIKSTNTLEGNTYYWQVRTIDAGLRKSAWSTAQLLYILPQEFIAPAGISNLTALNGGANTAILQWTSPGDDGASGNLITGSMFRIKYSSVAIITAANFDSPPAALAAQTIDISTAATTQSFQTHTVTGLTEKRYWFAIKAMDECENWSVWNSSGDVSTINTLSWCVLDATPPGQITGLTAVQGAQVQLTWTAPGDDEYVGNVTGGKWRIDYSSTTTTPGPDDSYTIEISSSFTRGATTYGCAITGLQPRATYYFQMIAQDGVGNWGTIWSSSASSVTGIFADHGAGLTGVYQSALSWGDYDNDGDLDLVLTGSYGSYISRIYRNDAGTFGAGPTLPVGVYYGSVSWGDYDNDGDLDLALSGFGTTYITRIYRNDASSFVDNNAGLLGSYLGSLAWGDYDNDGDLDLALAGYTTTYVSRLYRNDANSFTYGYTGMTGVYYSSLSWGDYDNDGDLDLSMAGYYTTYQNRVYRNNTAGSTPSFTITNITPALRDCTVTWGDYDNDGDLDLAMAGYSGAYQCRVFNNNGGTLTDNGAGMTGVRNTALSWGDYDNDGDLDLAMAGYTGTMYIFRIYRTTGASMANSGEILPGVQYGALSFGDYNNDGDLDLAVSGQTTGASVYISRIYQSFEADFGNANTDARKPSAPTAGFDTSYSFATKKLSLRWGKAADNGAGATPSDGMYYEIRMATETITDGLSKWVVSPSTGLGVGSSSSQNIGNYPHGYCVASSTQPGITIASTTVVMGSTYYWQVRAIDAGLRKSAWSAMQSFYVTPQEFVVPGGISDLTALNGGVNAVMLNWTAPGDDGESGNLTTGSMFRIKYSTVAIITAADFDTPPAALAAQTIDISTTATAQSAQSRIITGLSAVMYWFAIKAMDESENWSVWNSSGDVAIVNTLAWYGDPAPPGQITGLTAVQGEQVQLTWTAPGDDGYNGNVTGGMWRIAYSSGTETPGQTGGAGVYTLYISTDFIQGATTYTRTITGLQPRARYYFQMLARDEQTWSAVWSSSVSEVAGGYLNATGEDIPGVVSSRLAWGDYDNDGDMDLAIAGEYGTAAQYARVYRNEAGTFANATAETIIRFYLGALSWGDYDNDGDLDLAIAGEGASILGDTEGPYYSVSRVYRNTNGNFSKATADGSLMYVINCDLAWGDYDNDGDLDLAFAGEDMTTSKYARVYTNNGGSFVDATGSSIMGVTNCSLAWGDYDGDGDLDLALAGSAGSSYSRVYRNDYGSFVNATGDTITGVSSCSMAWGDYDNDGALDLALSGSSISRVYRNDAGSFVDTTGSSITGVTSCSLSWGDYDNDGDLDLALAGTTGTQYSRVYRNDAGSFVNATGNSLTGVQSGSLAFGDYDTDGDLDLALCGNTGSGYLSRVYRSLEADYGNVNAAPGAPTGLAASFDYSVARSTITFQWDPGQYDTGRSSCSLYYQITVATATMTWNGTKFISPSSFTFTWQHGSPLMGNYVRPAAQVWPGDSDPKHKIFFSTTAPVLQTNTTYYWRVRAIDAGLRCGSWSDEESIYTQSDILSPAGISDLTALDGGSGIAILQWTSPGDDDTSGDLAADSMFRIKYSSVAIITAADFDSPPAALAVQTIDISTTATALSIQSRTITGLTELMYWFAIETMDESENWSVWNSSEDVSTANTLAWYDRDVSSPAGISDLTALDGGINTAMLQWTSPGDDDTSGDLAADSMFRIKYSSVAIITAADFDSPPAALAVQTIDISTTATALSIQSRTITGLTEARYWFAIKTVDESENWSVWNSSGDVSTVNTLAWVTFDATPPGQITGLTAAQGAQVKLTWTAPGDDGYSGNVTGGMWRIDYSSTTTTPGGAAGAYSLYTSTDYAQGSVYTLSVTGLQPLVTYYFQVRARDEAGNWSAMWSSSESVVALRFVDIGASLTGVYSSAQSWGDYDNDGDLDLALAGLGSITIARIYRNDVGRFVNATGTTITAVYQCSLSWGDYDNDGDLDLALAGYNATYGNLSRVYRNTGGSFSNRTGTSITGVQYCSLAWGDYDNDGDLDLALAGSYGGSRVYSNDGGAFTNATGTALTGVQYCSLSWGDHDNDGDLDLALAGDGSPGITRVYRNDTTGTTPSFALTNITPVLQDCTVTWGDYDNDGDLDLALAGYSGAYQCRVFRNNAGTLTDNGAGMTGVRYTALSWGDYDNDGDLDLAMAGYTGSVYIARIYRTTGASMADSGEDLPGVQYGALSFGDYDNDGDLDLALSGQTTGTSVYISRIYESYEADSGNANTDGRAPSAPSAGFDTAYSYLYKTLSLRWSKASDNGAGTTPSAGLYYEIRMATETITDDIQKWIISPSTGLGVGSCSSQNFGNYPHGYCVASSTQPGIVISSTTIQMYSTYYWQVRSIDAGLRKSAWSAEQSYYVADPDPIPPGGISDLTALDGGPNTAILQWTAPGDDDTSGDLLVDSMFRIKYSSVAIITAADFDSPPAVYAVQTIDISTTAAAQSVHGRAITGLTAEMYWFAIKTLDESLNWSVWNSSADVSTVNTLAWYQDITPPGQITQLTAVPGTQVQLSWTAPGDDGYGGNVAGGKWRIDYSSVTTTPGPDDSYTLEISSSFTQGAVTYGCTISGLQLRTTYYFQMIACDGFDNWATVWSSSASAVPGTFSDLEAGLTGVYYSALSWGDYDNDGDLDLVILGSGGSTISRIYRNDAGAFGAGPELPVGVNSGSLSWGDYDNDGDLDLALSGIDATYITRIYRNDGSAFVDNNAGLLGSYRGAVAWGDYDNDGDLDLAYAGYTTTYISRLYRNDANSFTYGYTGLTGAYYSSLSWGDYDNDGDLDLSMAGYYTTYLNRVYRNNTTGSTPSFTITNITPALRDCTVTWGDYDNDGDLDLAMAGYSGAYQCRVFNNNAGTLTDNGAGMTGVRYTALSWGDYDNDGDLDLAMAGYTGSVYISRIYRTTGASMADSGEKLPGVQYGALSFGDYDNDGDLDLALLGQTTGSSVYISRIYRSFEADSGNANTNARSPSAPSTGFDTSYSYTTKKLSLRWGESEDNGAGATSTSGLYFEIRMATETISDSLLKWVISPSTGLGVGSGSSQNFGSYPHGYCVASSTQPGIVIASTTIQMDSTYYWQVRSIDAGLRKSVWSAEQSYYVGPDTILPGAISDLTALYGGPNTAILQWTAPGDDDTSGDLLVDSMFRIKYSSVAIITAGDFDSPPAAYAVKTIDVSTTAAAQSVHTRTITGLTAGVYWFAIKTMDEALNWSVWNSSGDIASVNTMAWYQDIFPPGQITGLTAATGCQVLLTWTAPGDDGYGGNVSAGRWRIDYSSVTTTPGPDDSYTLEISSSFEQGKALYKRAITGLQPHVAYYFQIVAMDGVGNWGTVWSSSASAVAGPFIVNTSDLTGVYFSAQSWGDYDNDGDLDLALAGAYSGTLGSNISHVYRNDGGNFVNATGATITGLYECSLSWGDYDNDGDLDLALAGTIFGSSGVSKVYRNNSGSFTDISGTSLTGVYNCSLSWGDYDNDGDLDLALAGYSGSLWLSRVYRNDEAGFLNATDTSVTGLSGSSLGWGDYDNDGDLDLALSGWDGNNLFRMYRNDVGILVNVTPASIMGADSCSLSWGDYDNDGDLDLALAGYAYNAGFGDDFSRVYRNDGGSFVNATGTSIWKVDNCSLSWGDYDNDGDLDLALAGSGTSYVYRNDAGSFVNATGTAIPGVWNCSLNWGDYDNDGDLDLANSGQASGTAVYISRIYQSCVADFGNANKDDRAPSAPSEGFDTSYLHRTLSLRWNKATDNGTGATPSAGLYYEIRLATETITDGLRKWIVSPSTGLGVGSGSSQNFGSYPHGYCVASSTQPGATIISENVMFGTTYYWQVRTIDAGLRKSAWSAEQVCCALSPESNPPGGISDLTALAGGPDAAILQWTAPGNDDTSGPLLTDSKFRIKYSSVAIISAADFDNPPAAYAVRTIDISTAAPAQSAHSRMITGLTEGIYWFAIKTMDESLNWSVWNSSADVSTVNALAWYQDLIPPGQITQLTAVPGTQVQLTWTAPGDDGYGGNVAGGKWRIDYSSTTTTPGSDDSYTLEISSSFTQGTATYGCTIENLQAWTTYYFQMIACDGVGNWATEWSSSASVVPGIYADNDSVLTGVYYSAQTWGDYDNDGDLDLAQTGQYGTSVYLSRIYRNDEGSFVSGPTLPVGVYYGSLSWGDYDNDGDLDLALSGYGSTYITRIYNNSGGSSLNDNNANLPGTYRSALAWGDYDNDGDLDLAYAGYNTTYTTRLYRNDANSFVYGYTGMTGVYYSSLSWGDYDNDGDLDLALAGYYTTYLNRVYRNDTTGSTVFTGINITPALRDCSVTWGDYDNDGDLDLAMAGNSGTYQCRVFNNAGGALTDNGAGMTGIRFTGLSWGDYDNDGDLDLATSGLDVSVYVSRIYRTDGVSQMPVGETLPGVQYGVVNFGDYDNDGDLDLALSGQATGASVYISRIYQSFEADYGNANKDARAPSPPSAGFDATYSSTTKTLSLIWDKSTDNGAGATPSAGLYYEIRMATETISDGLKKWTISPSTGLGVGSGSSQNFGNYPHGYCVASSTQPGIVISSMTIKTGYFYYWQVRTIDAGLRKSAWSTQQSCFVAAPDDIAPGGISDLTALGGGSNIAILQWTAPGDDGETGNLVTNSKFRIKYSSVAIISAADFDNPPAEYAVLTIDISTTATALSRQSRTITGLTAGMYWFAIKTKDDWGYWSIWNSSGDVATVNTLAWCMVSAGAGGPPNAPSNLAQYASTTSWTAITAGSWVNYQNIVATFTLTDPDGANLVQYNIQFSTYADFSYNFVNSTAPETATLAQGATHYISPLLPDGTWYWRVRALDGDGYASAFASMTAVNGIHFGIDATVPQAITTLSAVTGFESGVIHLNWTSPGDDGAENEISGGAYRVRYATYVAEAGDYWTDASANWTDWANKYEVAWATGTAPLATQERTLTGLTAGVTYYIRVWARDEIAGSGDWDGNWSALSFGATTYAQALLLDVNAQPDIALDLDSVATRTTKILASSYTVINTGNVQVKYRLQLTGVPAVWTVRETPGATAGYDQIKLLALFTTMNPPGSADFTDDIAPNAGGDIVRASTYDVATSSSFAIATEDASVKGTACSVGAVRRLWFRFDAPWATAVITQQNLTVTVTAIQD